MLAPLPLALSGRRRRARVCALRTALGGGRVRDCRSGARAPRLHGDALPHRQHWGALHHRREPRPFRPRPGGAARRSRFSEKARSGADPTEDTPTAVLVRQVLGAISQFEKASLVAKLNATRDRKRAATGKCGGMPSLAETRPRGGRAARRLRHTRCGGNARCARSAPSWQRAVSWPSAPGGRTRRRRSRGCWWRTSEDDASSNLWEREENEPLEVL
jgi:hypothetical protein